MDDITKKDYEGYPPQDHKDVGKWCYNQFLIAKAEKDRLKMHSKWLVNYSIFRGDHFKNKDSKYPLVPVNLAYVTVSRTKANLTDNQPRFEVVARDEQADTSAPVMNAAAIDWWQRTRQQINLSDSIHNSELYGSSIEKTVFDTSLESGLGDATTLIVDNFKVFPWPGIREIQKMPKFFEVEILELDEIVRRWPETGSQVKAEDAWSDLVGKDRENVKAGTSNSTISAAGNLPKGYVTSSGPGESDKVKRAMVIECWVRDYTTVSEMQQQPMIDDMGQPSVDPMTGQPMLQDVEITKPKYPGNIRCLHIANEGKVVLDDVPNPSINPNLPIELASQTYLWDKFPYNKLDSNTDTSNFWAFSIIEQIEILIRELNKKISQIAAYIDKTIRPTIIMPMNIGVEQHNVSNLPGQIWWVTNPVMSQYARYLQPPPLNQDFYNYIKMLLELIDSITGIHDVTQGKRPTGVTAASAIIALQEKAETMFREKIRNLTLVLEERGRMWISHVQNWYTEERKLKLSGKLKEDMQMDYLPYRGSDMLGQYGFEVATGSTMPKSMFVRQQQAQSLFTIKAIDQKALLEAFEWPDREQVMQRMMLGPLGMLEDRLMKAGMPPEIIQTIDFVGKMDDQQFKKTFEQVPKASGGGTAPAGRQTPSGTGGLGLHGGVK